MGFNISKSVYRPCFQTITMSSCSLCHINVYTTYKIYVYLFILANEIDSKMGKINHSRHKPAISSIWLIMFSLYPLMKLTLGSEMRKVI